MRTWTKEGLGLDEWAVGILRPDNWADCIFRVHGEEIAQFIVDACNEKEAALEDKEPTGPDWDAIGGSGLIKTL